MRNAIRFISNTQTAPQGYFVCYAKRLAKNRFFIRRNPYYALRRHVAHTAFLQMPGVQEEAARECPTFFSQPAFSYFRIYSRIGLRNHHGIASHKQNRHSSIQRCIFTNARSGSISRPVNSSAFSQTTATRYDSKYCSTARQPESISVSFSPATPRLDFRLGFDGHRHLRRTATWRGRVQPEKAGTSFVSSIALLRVLLSRILAWQSSSRQYGCRNRSYSFYKAMPGESAFHHCQKPYSFSHGFRFLFQSRHWLFGRHRLSVRHCRKGISSHKEACDGMQVSCAWQWMGNSGVQRESSSYVGKAASVYRCTPPDSSNRRRSKPTDIVQRQEVCLSCICYQSDDQPVESVSLLQSPSHHREKYPGTYVRLSSQQNTHRRLDRQCGIFSVGAVCCEYRSLVQTPLLTERISLGNAGYHPYRFPRIAGTACQKAWDKCRQTASRLPLSERIPTRFSKYRVFTITKTFSILQKAESSFSMKQTEK